MSTQTKVIQVLVKPEIKQIITEVATSEGLSESAYVRQLVLRDLAFRKKLPKVGKCSFCGKHGCRYSDRNAGRPICKECLKFCKETKEE